MFPTTLGASDAWNAMLYGETNPNTVNFMQNQLQSVRNMFTQAGQGFLAQAESAFNLFNGADAINFARNTINKFSRVADTSRIMELTTLEQLQGSGLVMQRWIMAEPSIRALYNEQRCDGFADSYIDVHPGAVGIDHYDWRLANNGMVLFQPDGGYVAHQFPDELLSGDRALTFQEKCAVAITHEALRAYVEQRTDDPSSPTGGKF
jgi:hypothetical protein